jgi:hypothetical protein
MVKTCCYKNLSNKCDKAKSALNTITCVVFDGYSTNISESKYFLYPSTLFQLHAYSLDLLKLDNSSTLTNNAHMFIHKIIINIFVEITKIGSSNEF